MNEQNPINNSAPQEPVNLSKQPESAQGMPGVDPNQPQSAQNNAQQPVYRPQIIDVQGNDDMHQQNVYQNGQPNAPRKTNDHLGLVSLICGVLAFLLSCCGRGLMIPFVGSSITFGVLSIKKDEPDRWMAIIGIVLGGLSILMLITIIVLSFMFGIGTSLLSIIGMAEGFESAPEYYYDDYYY